MSVLTPQVFVVAGSCLFAALGGHLVAQTDLPSSPVNPVDVPTSASPSPQSPAAAAAPGASRVGGDKDVVVDWRDETWQLNVDGQPRMSIEAPLPEGYPAPTPPGAIEIKTYPSVRRAEYTGRGNAEFGMNGGFWPLFQHIQRNSIAMTSPVEMDYTGWTAEASESGDDWTMSFLYRTADLGPTGEDGPIRIVDTEPVTVIAIGVRGAYGRGTIAPALETLMDWLANQPTDGDRWELAGDPRAFYYNGPSVRNANKWAEAQLPIRPVTRDQTEAPTAESPTPGA